MIPVFLSANPSLARWVEFGADGTVRIAFGKVEYGQGAMTALAQIGAEELDVDWTRARVEEPATGSTPDEFLTVGSMSVEMSGPGVRLACAEVRALFLDHAARTLGCSRDDLSIEDGAVLRGGRPTGLTYWTMAGDVDLDVAPTGEVEPKSPDGYRIVGRSKPRLDLGPKLFGAAFIHDVLPENVLHARVLRQPGAKAKLKSLNEAAIKKAAGGDVEIFREGEFVAVLSPSEAAAGAALDAAVLGAQWDDARIFDTALSDAASLRDLPAETFETGAPKPEPSNRRRVTAVYSKPYIAHGSLGPSCGVAEWRDGKLTVWTHAQGVYPIRATIAGGLGLALDEVDVHHMQGPGNYGHNGSDDAAFDAAFLALRHPGRPVRVQWRREDEFAYAPVGPAMRIALSAELDAAGRIADYTAELWSPPQTNRGRAIAETAIPPVERKVPADAVMPPWRQGARFSGAVLNATPSYDIEATRVTEHAISAPPVRTSSLRGLGGPPNEFAGECFVDELAHAAGEDPLRYRLAMLSDPRARAVLERAAELGGWDGRWEAGTGRGLGLAFCIHRNRGAYVAQVAEVEVDVDVRLTHVWCVADAGLIVNPDGARNQIEGGIVMAASWALKEQVRLGETGIESTTWDDYPILRFDEVPQITIELIDRPHEPAMGIGEISSGPAMAAIGNAVAHALGARIRDLPFTRERIAASLLSEND
jgi:CO/xanthine dehydrogenase Mo-binding subunit